MKENELEQLKHKAREIREITTNTIGHLGSGHIGGCMSIVEVLTILYYKFMRFEPDDPKMKNRDYLILSKGHAGPTLYSILSDLGFFPKEWLSTLNKGGTNLPSHCDMNKTPGIDMTTGSLGLGLSAAVGIALGNNLDEIKSTVYIILGDGEINEGQIWEAAMAASHYKLSHLIAFLDYNKMQIDGYVQEIMNIEDITSKFVAFGWFVQRINGHDFEELARAIERAKEEQYRPSMIVLDTIKGKGIFFAEGKIESHNMQFNQKAATEAISKLQ